MAKKKAVRNPLTGKVEYYEGTKSVGLRNPLTGRIEKRVSSKKAKERGTGRTYTCEDMANDWQKKSKKKKSFW